MNRGFAHPSESVGLNSAEVDAQSDRNTVRQVGPAVVAVEARSLGRTAGRPR